MSTIRTLFDFDNRQLTESSSAEEKQMIPALYCLQLTAWREFLAIEKRLGGGDQTEPSDAMLSGNRVGF